MKNPLIATLKTCPWASVVTSRKHQQGFNFVPNTGGNIRYAECSCGAHGPWASSDEEAAQRWNQRGTPTEAEIAFNAANQLST